MESDEITVGSPFVILWSGEFGEVELITSFLKTGSQISTVLTQGKTEGKP